MMNGHGSIALPKPRQMLAKIPLRKIPLRLEWQHLNLFQLQERLSLFEDAIFKKSQEWRLSTSGLSEGWWFRGTG